MDPIEQPADWKEIDDKPEWCEHHVGGKQETDECIAAQDNLAVAQGLPPPPVAANKLCRDNKLRARKARAKQGKINFCKASSPLYRLPLNDV